MSYVQSNHADSSGTSAPTVTLGAAPTSGNLLVAWVSAGSSTVPTANTGWTIPTSGSAGGGSGGSARSGAWMWKVAGASESATQTPANSIVGWNCDVLEYSQLNDSVTPVDIASTAITASAATVSTPTVTPTASATRLVFTGYTVRIVATWSTEQVNGSATGVTEREDFHSAATVSNAVADLSVTSTSGTYAGVATPSSAAVGVAGIMIVKSGAAAAAPTQQTLTLLGVGI